MSRKKLESISRLYELHDEIDEHLTEYQHFSNRFEQITSIEIKANTNFEILIDKINYLIESEKKYIEKIPKVERQYFILLLKLIMSYKKYLHELKMKVI
jgi:hypothetical protein